MSELDKRPREDLIKMLLEQAWCSGGREGFDRFGYSFDVKEETAIRDVNYRNQPLYHTQEEALLNHWKFHSTPLST